ncbi:hypothetical protein DL93DRAFT_2098166 [Clavulina sp. PMI_390]|nr:hypothetical protein DL93DRAFT_2098166 [Clavulina sp. PMI_390]
MVKLTRLTLLAAIDQFPLNAQQFEPTESPTRASAVILNATALHSRFYQDFGFWLAEQGIGVITIDYRYTGLSWPKDLIHLVGRNSTVETRAAAFRQVPEDIGLTSHWGERDAAAAVRYAAGRWRGVPLTLLGHSLGGGNWFDPIEGCRAFRKLVYPHFERDRVFYSSRSFGGDDYPFGPGKEWLESLISPLGVQHTPRVEQLTREFDKPYLYIGFADDEVFGRHSMTQHMAQLSHSDGQKASLWIDPAAQSPRWPKCAHIQSFLPSKRSKQPLSELPNGPPPLTRAETIWKLYRDYIISGAVDTSLGEYRIWKPEDEFDPAEKAQWVYSLKENEPLRRKRYFGGRQASSYSDISAAAVAKL